MPLKLVLAFATVALLPLPAEAQERTGRGGNGVRDSCREEARLAFKKDRTNRLDPAQMKELRREYAQNCRKRAKAG